MKCSWDCILVAGIGGMAPNLAKVGLDLVENLKQPAPEMKLYIGLVFLFICGAVVAIAFSETSIRKAFVLGISAPGLITNLVASGPIQRSSVELFSPSSAYAQNESIERNPSLDSLLNEASNSTTRQKLLIINSNIAGAGKWSKENVWVNVKAINANGTESIINSINGETNEAISSIPTTTKSIVLESGGVRKIIDLPEDKDLRAIMLDANIELKGQNDFLWALGQQRRPNVDSITSGITGVE